MSIRERSRVDITATNPDVRCHPESRHSSSGHRCPLSAKSKQKNYKNNQARLFFPCSYKHMRMAAIALLFCLTGCTTSGDWFQREDPKPAPMATEVVPQQASPQGAPQQATPRAAPNRNNMSPAASAAAPADANTGKGELMECVSESCKINCSPKVAMRARPKWCVLYKEPTE